MVSTIRSAVLIQYTRVTDGRTDGIGVTYTRYSTYAVARKKVETRKKKKTNKKEQKTKVQTRDAKQYEEIPSSNLRRCGGFADIHSNEPSRYQSYIRRQITTPAPL